jgi:hypothetical protein
MQSMTMSETVGPASAPFSPGPGGRGRVSRPLIVAAVVISVLWTVAAALIHVRVFWLFAVLHVGPVLVSVAAFAASAVLSGRRPAGFEVREGVGFAVPAGRGFGFLVVGELTMTASLTLQLVVIWSWGGAPDDAFRYWARAVMSAALLVVGGLVALLVVTALRGRPQILLTPRAVVQEDWWGSRTIPWEALPPGSPVRQVRRRLVTLVVDRPELVVGRGLFRGSSRRLWLVMAQLRVRPEFLADAIGFYAGHPERRDAIGTRAEYERHGASW